MQKDAEEETRWKLVHGDVFRPPQYPMFLAALLGSGVQLFCMVVITIGRFAFSFGKKLSAKLKKANLVSGNLISYFGFASVLTT